MFRLAAVLILLLGGAVNPLSAEPAPVVLDGRYEWDVTGEQGDLRVTFEARKDDHWTVVFDFDHYGTRHVYRGSATGNLENGELTGEVRNEKGDRTFRFEGSTRNRIFRGFHSESTGRADRRGGTLTMKPAEE